MIYKRLFDIVFLTLFFLGGILSACGNANAHPLSVEAQISNRLLVSEPFIEQKKGYTIRYPQGWEYRWEDHGDAVRFIETGKTNQKQILSGPTVVIAVAPIKAFDEAKQSTDPQVILKTILDGQSFNLNSKAGKREGSIEKIEPITVGGKDAAIATLRGTEDGINFSARLVFVHTGDRGAIILAVGKSEDWKTFDLTFEAMLETMTFIEPSDQ